MNDPIPKFPANPSAQRRVVLLTSPKAGSGANRSQIPRLMEFLAASGIDATLTHDPSDLDDLPRKELSGEVQNTVIVAAGGDGTVTLAASRLLAATEKIDCGDHNDETGRTRIPIVPMPLGTENLLARHFGHQVDADHVLQTIVAGTPHSIDLGSIQSPSETSRSLSETSSVLSETSRAKSRIRPMLTMATCGFDAEVVRQLHLRRSGHIQRSSYFGPILRGIRRYRFPEITIEAIQDDGTVNRTVQQNGEVKCGWAMVFNLPCYGGGLSIEPDAIGHDGLLDVIAFQGRSIASGLRYVAGIKSGRHLNFSDIVRFKTPAVRIHASDRVHYQIDGDYAGRLPIQIGIRPKAVALLLPPS